MNYLAPADLPDFLRITSPTNLIPLPLYGSGLRKDCNSYGTYRIINLLISRQHYRPHPVELPKFSPHTYSEKKMQVLWLRYLTEINENTREVPEDLIDNPEVKKAINALEESAFTDAQLLGYENFWDIISVEKTLYNSAERRGLKKVSSKRSLKLPEK